VLLNFANHANDTRSPNNFAFVADWLDTSANFHGLLNLFRPVNDPTSSQIVGGYLQLNLIAWENTDEMHPHFPADMSQHFVAVV